MSDWEKTAFGFLEYHSRYLMIGNCEYYRDWIEGQGHPAAFVSALRIVARRSTANPDVLIARSAIQALGAIGEPRDIEFLTSLGKTRAGEISSEATSAASFLRTSHSSVAQLLQEVDSKLTFMIFARRLASEREAAADIE